MYDIRTLTIDEWPLIEHILDARDKFQLDVRSPAFHAALKERLHDYLKFHTGTKMFGAFDDQNNMIAFANTRRWRDYVNYTLGVMSTDPPLHFPALKEVDGQSLLSN